MRFELVEREDGDWFIRPVFANGRIAGHRFRDVTDARRGADDLIAAIRSEGDGVEFVVIPARDVGDVAAE